MRSFLIIAFCWIALFTKSNAEDKSAQSANSSPLLFEGKDPQSGRDCCVTVTKVHERTQIQLFFDDHRWDQGYWREYSLSEKLKLSLGTNYRLPPPAVGESAPLVQPQLTFYWNNPAPVLPVQDWGFQGACEGLKKVDVPSPKGNP